MIDRESPTTGVWVLDWVIYNSIINEISSIAREVDQGANTHTPVVGLSLSITSKICIEFVTLSSVSTWMGDRNAPTSNENVKSCIDLAG